MSDTTPTTTSVHLVGGPDDWHNQTLTHVSATELDGDRENLGSYLISSHVPPGHPDPGARAVYEPNEDPYPPTLWFFRGWVPWSSIDPEERRADHHQAVDVAVEDLLPSAWTTDEGDHHRIDRILAHWQATGENQLAPDVWHVRAGDTDWELLQYPGHWQIGPLTSRS